MKIDGLKTDEVTLNFENGVTLTIAGVDVVYDHEQNGVLSDPRRSPTFRTLPTKEKKEALLKHYARMELRDTAWANVWVRNQADVEPLALQDEDGDTFLCECEGHELTNGADVRCLISPYISKEAAMRALRKVMDWVEATHEGKCRNVFAE